MFLAAVLLVSGGLWLAASRGFLETLSAGVLFASAAGLGLGVLLAVSAFERVRRAGVRLDDGLAAVGGHLSGTLDEARRAAAVHGDQLVRDVRRGAEHSGAALRAGLEAAEAHLDESRQRPES